MSGKKSRGSVVVVAVWAALVLSPAAAQTKRTVESRLLEMLRDKGVISAADHDELMEIAAEMRREDAQQDQLSAHVDELISRIQDEKKAEPSISYKKGRGFTFSRPSEKFRLNIGGRLQVRLTYDFWSKNDNTSDQDEPDFDVRRARIWFQGNAFKKWMRYKLQLEVAGDEVETDVGVLGLPAEEFDSSNDLTELKDAYFEVAKWRELRLRAGQFKVPYSRQAIASSGELQFVDRAITHRIFAPARDIGVMLSGDLGDDDAFLLEYAAGVFDGEGENRTNDDKGLLWAGRVAIHPFGERGYGESDLKGSESFKLAVGFNAWLHQDDGHDGRGDDWSIGLDFAAVWQGFSALFELHYQEVDVTAGPDVDVLGWMAQVGYMVIPEKLELGIRAASIDWDGNAGSESGHREYLVVVGWFFDDHDWKVQADFGRVEDHEGNDHRDNRDEWRLRVQFQMIF
ncbi:MAG: hypothetical protein CMJ83_21060 [Planctomycetes bacterium]|nr:hypothetical protein [Planctomycetota bacterium]